MRHSCHGERRYLLLRALRGAPERVERSGLTEHSLLTVKESAMSIVRSIEVIAQSPQGFDQACQEAIKAASKTLRGIRSLWIKNAEGVVENDKITMYRVNGQMRSLVGEQAEPSLSRRWA